MKSLLVIFLNLLTFFVYADEINHANYGGTSLVAFDVSACRHSVFNNWSELSPMLDFMDNPIIPKVQNIISSNPNLVLLVGYDANPQNLDDRMASIICTAEFSHPQTNPKESNASRSKSIACYKNVGASLDSTTFLPIEGSSEKTTTFGCKSNCALFNINSLFEEPDDDSDEENKPLYEKADHAYFKKCKK